MVYKKFQTIKFYLGTENKILIEVLDRFIKRTDTKNAYGKYKDQRSIIFRKILEEFLIRNYQHLPPKDKEALTKYIKERVLDKKKARTMEDTTEFLDKAIKKFNESQIKKEPVVTEPTQ